MPFPPTYDIPQEDPSSPFYGLPDHIVKAAKPLNLADAMGGRICSKTGMWVPRHRLVWLNGRPFLDVAAVSDGEGMPNPIVCTNIQNSDPADTWTPL